MGPVGSDPRSAPGTALRPAAEKPTAGGDDSDAALVARVITGDVGAFDALYRRHHEAAWRLALLVTSNRADAEDAVAEAFAKVFAALGRAGVSSFRPYLLRCVRNAATDAHRRTARLDLRDELDLTEGVGPARRTAPAAEELAAADDEAALALEALNALPERWRTVLWLTEVEEMGPADAGQILGLSANATAGLSFRAREGLRRAYLAAHLRPGAPAACAAVAKELPAYARGMLANRARDRVDAHLEDCAGCRQRLEDLDALNRRLAGLLVPAPLLLAPLARLRWAETASVLARRGALGTRLDRVTRSGPVHTAIGAAVVVLLVGGGLMLVAPDDGDPTEAPSAVTDAEAGRERAGPEAGTGPGRADGAGPSVAGEIVERPAVHGPGGGPRGRGAPGTAPGPHVGLAPGQDGVDAGGPGPDSDHEIPVDRSDDRVDRAPGPGNGGGNRGGDGGGNGGGGDGDGGGPPPGGPGPGPGDPGTVAGVGVELGQGPVGVVVDLALTGDGPDVDLTVGEQQVLGDAPPADGTCLTVDVLDRTVPVLCPGGAAAAGGSRA